MLSQLQAEEVPAVPVTVLDISNNPVGQQGANLLACVLETQRCPQHLVEVTVDRCFISDAGGHVLVRYAGLPFFGSPHVYMLASLLPCGQGNMTEGRRYMLLSARGLQRYAFVSSPSL
jgi:hypothetical protein